MKWFHKEWLLLSSLYIEAILWRKPFTVNQDEVSAVPLTSRSFLWALTSGSQRIREIGTRCWFLCSFLLSTSCYLVFLWLLLHIFLGPACVRYYFHSFSWFLDQFLKETSVIQKQKEWISRLVFEETCYLCVCSLGPNK